MSDMTDGILNQWVGAVALGERLKVAEARIAELEAKAAILAQACEQVARLRNTIGWNEGGDVWAGVAIHGCEDALAVYRSTGRSVQTYESLRRLGLDQPGFHQALRREGL